tara:strand:+ start:1691 stop:2161 length:471 start_codon:yes stop_codon:yes gene_type:complete
MGNFLNVMKTKDVKLPERSGRNAGFDFFVPNDIPHDDIIGGFYINPNDSDNIPSGIKVRLPKNHCLIAFNKSGIASKYNLVVGACVVDENYTGEIHLNVINVGTEPVLIKPGMKLVQFVLIKQEYCEVIERKTEGELYHEFDKEERGDKGFGSTGV